MSEALNNPIINIDEIEKTNWERARQVIEHENDLMNHRMTWLMASQSVLITLFVGITAAFLANQPNSKVTAITQLDVKLLFSLFSFLLILALFSCLLCFHFFIQMSNGAGQLSEVTKWWYSIPKEATEEKARQIYEDKNKISPRLHCWLEMEYRVGKHVRWHKPFLTIQVLPLYFIGFWAAISVWAGQFFFAQQVGEKWGYVFTAFGTITFMFSIVRIVLSSRFKSE